MVLESARSLGESSRKQEQVMRFVEQMRKYNCSVMGLADVVSLVADLSIDCSKAVERSKLLQKENETAKEQLEIKEIAMSRLRDELNEAKLKGMSLTEEFSQYKKSKELEREATREKIDYLLSGEEDWARELSSKEDELALMSDELSNLKMKSSEQNIALQKLEAQVSNLQMKNDELQHSYEEMNFKNFREHKLLNGVIERHVDEIRWLRSRSSEEKLQLQLLKAQILDLKAHRSKLQKKSRRFWNRLNSAKSLAEREIEKNLYLEQFSASMSESLTSLREKVAHYKKQLDECRASLELWIKERKRGQIAHMQRRLQRVYRSKKVLLARFRNNVDLCGKLQERLRLLDYTYSTTLLKVSQLEEQLQRINHERDEHQALDGELLQEVSLLEERLMEQHKITGDWRARCLEIEQDLTCQRHLVCELTGQRDLMQKELATSQYDIELLKLDKEEFEKEKQHLYELLAAETKTTKGFKTRLEESLREILLLNEHMGRLQLRVDHLRESIETNSGPVRDPSAVVPTDRLAAEQEALDVKGSVTKDDRTRILLLSTLRRSVLESHRRALQLKQEIVQLQDLHQTNIDLPGSIMKGLFSKFSQTEARLACASVETDDKDSAQNKHLKGSVKQMIQSIKTEHAAILKAWHILDGKVHQANSNFHRFSVI